MNLSARITAALVAISALKGEKDRLVLCLAINLGMHERSIYRKLEADDWRLPELLIIAAILGTTQEELLNPQVSLNARHFNFDISGSWKTSVKTADLVKV